MTNHNSFTELHPYKCRSYCKCPGFEGRDMCLGTLAGGPSTVSSDDDHFEEQKQE